MTTYKVNLLKSGNGISSCKSAKRKAKRNAITNANTNVKDCKDIFFYVKLVLKDTWH